MRNTLLRFGLVLFSMSLLASCSSNDDGNASSSSEKTSTPPVYLGMSVAHSDKASNNQDLNKFEDETQEKDDHQKQDDKIETDITDLVTIDVDPDEELKYYVQPNETFILEVHLSNPLEHEIQSFTINGKKYFSYMFKDSSTTELLLIELTAPAKPGYKEYTIDAIKYLDGAETYDVDMSKGNKTITTGVSYAQAPSASITSYEVNVNYIKLDIDVVDPEDLIGTNDLLIYLSDGKKIVDQKELKIGSNSIKFDSLVMSKIYQYGIITAYDFVDGNELHPEWMLKNTFTTLDGYEIKNVNASKTSITFDLNRIGEIGTVDYISLYDANTNELVQKVDSSIRVFDRLLSNHTYNLYVDFSYQVNDETVSDWVSYKDIKTIAKVEPTILFDSTSSDKTAVFYSVSTEDTDGTLSIEKVELLKNNEVIQDNGTTLIGSFTGLLSNNKYDVKVSYTYDLNDGQGAIANFVSKEIDTLPKIAPTISFDSTSSDKTSISYNVSTEDADGILNITKVELLKNGDAVKDNGTVLNGTFTGLLSNNDYSIKVSYTYDLNDGSGIKSDYIIQDVKTDAKVAPTLTFDSTSSDKTSVTYNVSTEDTDGILNVVKVELLKDDEVVKDNGNALSGKFSDLLSDNKYSVKVTYTYDLNDGSEPILSYISKDITTIAKVAPTLTFDSTSSDKTSVSYNVLTEDVDGILNITKVELIRNGEVVKDNGAALEGKFSDLLSNNQYSVKVTYTYDLNDGHGAIENSISKEVTTEAKTAPTVSIFNDEITDSTISSEIEFEDDDSVGFIDAVELFKGDELVATNTSKEIEFNDLDYYSDYKVVVTYKYDLNDGLGVQTNTLSKEYKTSPHLELNSCQIINTSAVSEGEIIFMQVSLDNPNRAMPLSVVINNKEYDCTSLTTSSKIFLEIDNSGQFDGGETVLLIQKIVLSLDGKVYEVIPTENNSDSIFIFGKLEVIDLYVCNANGDRKEIPFIHNNEQLYLGLELSNPTGYTIDSVVGIDSIEITDITRIDDDHWVFPSGIPNYYGSSTFNLSQISYSNGEMNKKLSLSFKTRLYRVLNDEDIGISSKEELKNIEFAHSYFLKNDIDLSGEEWTGQKFHGILNGNGYCIKNMSFIGTHLDSDISLGLFTNIDESYIYNLKITNSSFIVNIKASDGVSKYNVNSGFLSAKSFRSSFVNCIVDDDCILSITGDISEFKNSFVNHCGGICGNSYGGIFVDCINKSTIKAEKLYCVGGIVGGNSFDSIEIISNCANYGSITGDRFVGGIVGDSTSVNISNSINYGTIKGNEYTGGIVGVLSNPPVFCISCINYGDVYGDGSEHSGIVGNPYGHESSIIDCENYGNVYPKEE